MDIAAQMLCVARPLQKCSSPGRRSASLLRAHAQALPPMPAERLLSITPPFTACVSADSALPAAVSRAPRTQQAPYVVAMHGQLPAPKSRTRRGMRSTEPARTTDTFTPRPGLPQICRPRERCIAVGCAAAAPRWARSNRRAPMQKSAEPRGHAWATPRLPRCGTLRATWVNGLQDARGSCAQGSRQHPSGGQAGRRGAAATQAVR